MVKSDLIKAIQSQLTVPASTAQKVIDEAINQITIALANGEDVTLKGLGIFKVRCKKERMGRNPSTNEPTVITARSVVTFKTGLKLKNAVKDSNHA